MRKYKIDFNENVRSKIVCKLNACLKWASELRRKFGRIYIVSLLWLNVLLIKTYFVPVKSVI